MAALKRLSQGLWMAAGAMALGVAALIIQQRDEESDSFWAPLLVAPKPQAVSIVASATIAREAHELLEVWKNAELLPLILRFLHTVETVDARIKRWNLRGTFGASLVLDATLVREVPNSILVWTLCGEGVDGEIQIEATSAGERKTTLSVSLALNAPVRPDGPPVALEAFFGEAPAARLADDLRRLGVGMERGLLKV